MIIGIQDEILRLHSLGLLEILLKDKASKSNILWATDAYQELGSDYQRDKEIRVDLITGKQSGVIKNRARKALEQQTERTRQHAEVFTPLWICKRMNEDADHDWFPKKNSRPFDYSQKVRFLKKKKWWNYIDARRLEITCGEAPYLVSRYDVSTGESIPIESRIGLLDHKLRVVNENTFDEEEWLKWTVRAFQSIYGYEFQGDNVLIARVNLLMTFEEYLQKRWKRKPTYEEYRKIANIIVWNIWQMDGLTGTIPYCKAAEEIYQMSFFDYFPDQEQMNGKAIDSQPKCRLYDWRRDNSIEFLKINGGSNRNMKFDFVIGNPPYQQESKGANANDTPIYHYFYESAYKIADKVELISPARFLFNAGGTPKEWNAKMLNDEHLKILFYESDASRVFPNTAINGGIVITYRDKDADFGAIGIFTVFSELNGIIQKVKHISERSLEDIITNRGVYKYSELAYVEQAKEMEKTADRRIAPSAFERMPSLFTEDKPDDGEEYIQIFGNLRTERVYRWFRRKYVTPVENLDKYKVFISKADGAAGQLGKPIPARIIGKPVVMEPGIGCTETYITIGATDYRNEAEAIAKYVMTKFARTMIGVLKVTQNYAKPTWHYVPFQDFTPSSDIDWSKSVAEIDQQLYAKYGLNEKEIEFIESHVKEMS